MNIKSCACVLLHSFKVCDFNPTERKIHFRENWHIFWGNLGEAELILGICEARQNSFRELMIFFSGILVDQCIISKEHRLFPGRPQEHINPYKPSVFFVGHRQTVQTQIRRCKTRHLIRVSTDRHCLLTECSI